MNYKELKLDCFNSQMNIALREDKKVIKMYFCDNQNCLQAKKIKDQKISSFL